MILEDASLEDEGRWRRGCSRRGVTGGFAAGAVVRAVGGRCVDTPARSSLSSIAPSVANQFVDCYTRNSNISFVRLFLVSVRYKCHSEILNHSLGFLRIM